MEKNNSDKKDKTGIQNSGTQKIVAVSVIIVTLMVFAVAFVLYQNHKGRLNLLTTENSDLVYELSSRDSVINEFMNEFQNIESTLGVIKRKRNLLTDISEESSINQNRKDAIIHDIQVLNSLIDDGKARIEWLNKKLKESGMKIKQFEAKLIELEGVIDEKIADISILKDELIRKDFKLSELDKRVDTLQIQLENKIAVIKMQQDELLAHKEEINKAYYAQGSFKELKKKGLVKKEGGFLFLGRNKNIKHEFSPEDFEKVSIAETNVIPINARKVSLISEHPDNSFNFIEEEGLIAYLEIENPEEFWKISKYLVLETKN